MYSFKMTVQDRNLLIDWLGVRVGDVFPEEFIPQTGISIQDMKGTKLILPCYLAVESPVMLCGHCVANPENTPKESHEATKRLFKDLPEWAKLFGKKYVLALFGQPSICNLAREAGFVDTELTQQQIFYVR